MGTELQVFSLGEMQQMAEAIACSGLFGMKNRDQALALMLVAQAEGRHPATITQDYDIIQGKATRKTHNVMARFQQAGGKIEWHELTNQKAEATFSHPAGGTLRLAWTLEDAKRAKLIEKDNWKGYPRSMLRARLIAEGVRAVYPAAIGGMMISEEAADLGPAGVKDMGAAEVVEGVLGAAAPEGGQPPTGAPEGGQTIEVYPEERFAASLPNWRKRIEAGRCTAEDIIESVQAQFVLTEGQEREIRALTPASMEKVA